MKKNNAAAAEADDLRSRSKSLGAAMLKSVRRKISRKQKDDKAKAGENDSVLEDDELTPVEGTPDDPFRSSPGVRRVKSVESRSVFSTDRRFSANTIALPNNESFMADGSIIYCGRGDSTSSGIGGIARAPIPLAWRDDQDYPPVPPLPAKLKASLAATTKTNLDAKKITDKKMDKGSPASGTTELKGDNDALTKANAAYDTQDTDLQTNDGNSPFTHVVPDPPQKSVLLPKLNKKDKERAATDPATLGAAMGSRPPSRMAVRRSSSWESPRAAWLQIEKELPTPTIDVKDQAQYLAAPPPFREHNKPSSAASMKPTESAPASATRMNKGFPAVVTRILGEDGTYHRESNKWHVTHEGMMLLNKVLEHFEQRGTASQRGYYGGQAFPFGAQKLRDGRAGEFQAAADQENRPPAQ